MTRLDALDGHAFAEIQNGATATKTSSRGCARRHRGRRCAGVVRQRCLCRARGFGRRVLALEGAAPIPRLFTRMLAVMDAMHDANPSWGPLYVVHPGDIARDLVFAARAPKARRT
jgi:hypothetical protein